MSFCAQTWITQFYLSITSRLPIFFRKCLLDGATPDRVRRSIVGLLKRMTNRSRWIRPVAAYYSLIDPAGMKGWVGRVGFFDLKRTVYRNKWSPVNRSSAGQDSAWMPLYHRWRPVTLSFDLQVSYLVTQLEFNIPFLAQMWLHQKWKTRGGELSVPSTGRPAIYWPQPSPPFFYSHPTMERDRETRGPRDSRTWIGFVTEWLTPGMANPRNGGRTSGMTASGMAAPRNGGPSPIMAITRAELTPRG